MSASPGELRVEYLRAAAVELRRPTLAIAGRVVRVSLDSGVVHAPTPGRRDDPLGDILARLGAPRADRSLTDR